MFWLRVYVLILCGLPAAGNLMWILFEFKIEQGGSSRDRRNVQSLSLSRSRDWVQSHRPVNARDELFALLPDKRSWRAYGLRLARRRPCIESFEQRDNGSCQWMTCRIRGLKGYRGERLTSRNALRNSSNRSKLRGCSREGDNIELRAIYAQRKARVYGNARPRRDWSHGELLRHNPVACARTGCSGRTHSARHRCPCHHCVCRRSTVHEHQTSRRPLHHCSGRKIQIRSQRIDGLRGLRLCCELCCHGSAIRENGRNCS